MKNLFLDFCKEVYGVTPYQHNMARLFMDKHNKECKRIFAESRDFISTEEQATVQSTYGYSFIDNGVGYTVHVFCDFCGEKKHLPMSNHELDKFPAWLNIF